MSDNNTSLLLRMPAELKAALEREAKANGRKMTTEVNRRLALSLEQASTPRFAGYDSSTPATRLIAAEPGSEDSLTAHELALLDVFRRLPPEKQLALISLFK